MVWSFWNSYEADDLARQAQEERANKFVRDQKMFMLFDYTGDKIKEILKSVYGEQNSHYIEYNCDDPEDKTITQMFGWNKKDILTAINIYKIRHVKEKKMTREEAKEKLIRQTNSDRSKIVHSKEDDFLNKLEALGLIKFDEPEKEYDCRDVIIDGGRSTVAWKVIQALEELGYKIVKKD